jgi:hypothetical protein
MIKLDDKLVIESIIDHSTIWNWELDFSDNNRKLNESINTDYDTKKKCFKNYLLQVGSTYKKNFLHPLSSLEDFEKFLLLDMNYRDHVLHTFRVWGLGIFLYYELFKEYFDKKGVSEREFQFQWFLASVYHDIGYPLNKVQKTVKSINNSFKYLEFEIEVRDNKGALKRKLCSEPINKIINELFSATNRIESNFLDEKHGLISARILLFSLNKHLKTQWDPMAKKSLKAIILHTDTSEIFLDQDPLSTLLLICDELQEWDRLYSGDSIYRNTVAEYLNIDIIKPSQNSRNAIPIINYEYPQDTRIRQDKEEEKQDNLKRLKKIIVKARTHS